MEKNMGEHKSIKSKILIKFFVQLGEILDYYVYPEYQMSSGAIGSQAIDIAWLKDDASKFPLMIFEIESSSNNAITTNPAKIYGKDSIAFEKPLFFFHIIIDAAEKSQKYSDLMGLFGKHNYDIFCINKDSMNDLLVKIISQHRRINEWTQLEGMISLILSNDKVKELISLDIILPRIEMLIHDNQSHSLGEIYANIAVENKEFVDEYIKFLVRAHEKDMLDALDYQEYCSSIISTMINIGLLCYSHVQHKKNIDYIDLLQKYQNRHGYLQTIDYLPGLNSDYDTFIQNHISFYLALTVTLLKDNLVSQKYILDIMLHIIRKIQPDEDYVFEHHCSWALLVASSNSEFDSEYRYIKDLINQNGGIPKHILYGPSFINDYYQTPNAEIVEVPSVVCYKENLLHEFENVDSKDNIIVIALKSISTDFYRKGDTFDDLGIELTRLVINQWE